jgi:hypothetical protein
MAASGRKSADAVLLAALAAGATVGQAAEQTGLSERTIHRRLADPAFKQRLAGIRADMVQRAVNRLTDASTEATDALRGLLRADSEMVRLHAAKGVLELGAKLREHVEFEERLTALERRQEERSGISA